MKAVGISTSNLPASIYLLVVDFVSEAMPLMYFSQYPLIRHALQRLVWFLADLFYVKFATEIYNWTHI
jgi:hypothetical protein